MKVLVVAAHPDDEILGCGGTMRRLADEGHEIHTLILAEGITSRQGVSAEEATQLLAKLKQDAETSNNTVGARGVKLLDFPDNRMDTVALLDVVHELENEIERLQPDTVFTQHGGDLNIDHDRTFRAVLTATRPMQNTPVRTVYAYEVASSTEWALAKFEPRFTPDTFFDISKTLEHKVRAMESYESEARPFPHPRSPEALRAQAKRWGSASGFEAAEAFQTVRRLV